MATLSLDANHDLYVDINSNLALSFGVNEIIQEIKQNILALGISEYTGSVDDSRLSALIKAVILSVDGVLSLSSFSISNTQLGCGSATGIRINFTAITSDGVITVGI